MIVDFSNVRPPAWRRLLLWTGAALLLLAGVVLGLLIPRPSTTIEFGTGSQLDLLERSTAPIAPIAVVSEFHETYTTLWLLAANDPAGERVKLVDIPHASGWDIDAAASPDGRAVAALVIPPGAWDPARHAALLVIDERGVHTIAESLDLWGGVIWSDDGQRLIARRGGAIRLFHVKQSFDNTQIPENNGWSGGRAAETYPIAMRDDTVWAAVLDAHGTSIVTLRVDGARLTEVERAAVSDSASRGWTLSPDAQHIAFTDLAGAELGVRVQRLSQPERFVSSSVRQRAPAIQRAYPLSASPVWHADGALQVGSWAGATGSFTLPIAWDSAGRWLALRSLTGAGPGEIHDEHLAFSGPNSTLHDAPAGLRFIGWWTA